MDIAERIAQLENALAAQENLRAALGDAIVDTTVAALRAQLAALRAEQAQAPPADAGAGPGAPRPAAPGGPNAAGSVEAERKQVTVLFGDISGFTALAERLDPEEVTLFTSEALQELAGAVYEHEGHIDKFMGDAVMAVFGAPVAHEDDPDRALRAALAMRARLADLSRRWAERLGTQIAMHTGINTGTVIAGNVGSDLHLAYTVMGDTVNVAARLKDAARPGEILVSQDTFRLTREAFSFHPLEPITVKGKREPLVVYALLAANLDPGKSRGFKGLASVLVGRERELEQLRTVMRAVEDGHGWIVSISGDAGIGKSRLLAEWQAELTGESTHAQAYARGEFLAGHAARATWLEGRAFAHTTSLAYGPFLYLFRRHIGIRSEDTETTARSRLNTAITRMMLRDHSARVLLANLLSLHLSGDEQSLLSGLSAEAVRLKLFALIEDLFARLASQRPTWLIVEDMHWADPTSTELIEHLLPLTERLPLVVVAVFRPDAAEAPRKFTALAQARYPAHYTHIALAPLSASGTLHMVEHLLQTPALPESLRALILEKAEGNPFFVEEVIRSLIERGALVRAESGGGWVVTPLIDTVLVPDTLEGMIMARLDRLPVETKRVVQQASVIGRIFPYRVLQRIAGAGAGLDAALALLEREALIRERSRRPELEYTFKHALTQETAYQSLLAPRRRALHRKAGAAIEALFPERLGEFHSILANHFLAGEDWDKALHYLVKAGDDAARLFAYVEAHVHYSGALRALAHLGPTADYSRGRLQTILKLADVGFTIDDPAQNLARLAEAETLAQSIPDPQAGRRGDRRALAQVHFQMGRAHLLRSQPREGLAYLRQVLSVAQALGDEELVNGPASVMGQALVWQGRFEQAAPLLTQGTAPLEKQGNWREWIWSAGYFAVARAGRGDYAGALGAGHYVLERARETHDLMAMGAAYIVQCLISLMGGDTQRMLRESRAVLTLAEQSGARVYVYQAHAFRAWAESRLGRHDLAAASLAQSKSVSDSLGGHLILSDWFAAAEAEILLNARRPEEARAAADAAVGAASAVDGLFGAGLAQRVWGQAVAACDPEGLAEAESHLTESLEIFRAGGACLEEARTHAAWCRLLHACGDLAGARRHGQAACAQLHASDLQDELAEIRRLLAG